MIFTTKNTNISIFLSAYIECALWTEEKDDLSYEDYRNMRKDCIVFVVEAWEYLRGLDMSECGHDFWLTRNHHGCGFWNGDYPKKIGDKLTKISHNFGNYYLNN